MQYNLQKRSVHLFNIHDNKQKMPINCRAVKLTH